jgi:S-DNA-T family DNA segregation ATPase FtsK/SpoIIIE
MTLSLSGIGRISRARWLSRCGTLVGVDSDHEHCDACGFDGGTYSDDELLGALRELGGRWRQQLADAGPSLRTRPAPATWSAIEYAAHSRDVTALHAYGVEQALIRDEPAYPAFRDDVMEEAAKAYSSEDPGVVIDELMAAAGRLADLAAHAGVAAWGRGLTVGEARSDVRRLLEHALHDSQHHLDDVERGLRGLAH